MSRDQPEASACVGRNVMSEAVTRGIENLQDASIQYAKRRAQSIQRAQTTSLSVCATEVQGLDHVQRKKREELQMLSASRSTNFNQHPSSGSYRNERLELLETLQRGPGTFEPRSDDPNFEHFEPYSNVKLKYISFAKLQQYMDCRYAISPSTLYSLTSRTGSASSDYQKSHNDTLMDGSYEVPLFGDWVLFAVIGEKSPMRYTAPPEFKGHYDEAKERVAKKYFGFKLFDLDTKFIKTTQQLPGHCRMNMLVFESTDPSTMPPSSERQAGGAFEKLWKERDGVLVAFLNPSILKKRKGSNELTISPRSADSILVIGRAEHYAQCQAQKKDGKRCTSFVLKVPGNTVCDYHLESMIASQQRSRMEFATSTSSLIPPPKNVPRNFTGKPSKRVHYRTDLSGLDVSGTSLDTTYVVSGNQAYLPPSDPRSHAYDITARMGHEHENLKLRKRKERMNEELIASMRIPDTPRKTPKITEPADPDELDKKFLSQIGQHSAAAKSLHIAQATLRGENASRKGVAQSSAHVPGTDSSTSRLLARQTMTASELPKAQLRSSRFRSNVLDRDGPGARHVEILKHADIQTPADDHDYEDDDDDLIILDKPTS